eukprot:jgi/Orpsp1_1/1179103/evm.model.c7180000067932.2
MRSSINQNANNLKNYYLDAAKRKNFTMDPGMEVRKNKTNTSNKQEILQTIEKDNEIKESLLEENNNNNNLNRKILTPHPINKNFQNNNIDINKIKIKNLDKTDNNLNSNNNVLSNNKTNGNDKLNNNFSNNINDIRNKINEENNINKKKNKVTFNVNESKSYISRDVSEENHEKTTQITKKKPERHINLVNNTDMEPYNITKDISDTK